MRFIFISTLLFCTYFVNAEFYNLDELIEIGLQKSFTIYQEQISMKNNQSDLQKSHAAFIPSLQWSASKSNYDGEWNTISSGINLSESYSSNEPRYFAFKQAYLQKKQGELTYEDVQKQVAYKIFNDYISILQTQKTLEIQKKNMELQQSVQKQVKLQYDNGEKTLLDLQQSEISLLDYEIALNEAQNELTNLRIDLFAFLEIDDAGYEFVEVSLPEQKITKEFKENLQLKIEQFSIKSQEINLFQQKLDFYPVFSLSFSYGFNNATDEYGNLNSFLDYSKYEDSYQIGLHASYSFSSIIDKRISYSRSKRNLKLKKISFEKAKRDDKLQLERLNRDLSTLQESYKLYEQKLKLAQTNLEMAQEQYRLGLVSLLDLDKIVIDYSNTQLGYYQRYYNMLRKQEEINVLLSDKILGKW